MHPENPVGLHQEPLESLRLCGSIGFSTVWTDKEVRKRLRENPRGGLRDLGIDLPDSIAVKTVASKGSPGDVEEASLLQFLLESNGRTAYFFLPSPRSPCAQQAAYGRILSRELDAPVFAERLRLDAAAALRELGSAS